MGKGSRLLFASLRVFKPRKVSDSLGFTLMEMMIVLVILAAVVTMAMPYLSNRNTQVHAVLRDLTVLSRELHTRAKLQGVTYRLVIDLGDDRDGQNPKQSYWVQRGSAHTVLTPDEEEQSLKREQEKDSDDKKPSDGFADDSQFLKGHQELASGLKFDRVELSRVKDPITHGKAFIHYLPEGLADEAAIHLKGEKNQAWTISIHPLTGRAEVISKTVSLQEIKSQ